VKICLSDLLLISVALNERFADFTLLDNLVFLLFDLLLSNLAGRVVLERKEALVYRVTPLYITTRVELVMHIKSFISSFLLVFADVPVQILNCLAYILRVRRVTLNHIILEV
jgi:hypothetical protein